VSYSGILTKWRQKAETGCRGYSHVPARQKEKGKEGKRKNLPCRKSGRPLFTNARFIQKDMAQPKEKDEIVKKGMGHG